MEIWQYMISVGMITINNFGFKTGFYKLQIIKFDFANIKIIIKSIYMRCQYGLITHTWHMHINNFGYIILRMKRENSQFKMKNMG
jgi:hypothetical protein